MAEIRLDTVSLEYPVASPELSNLKRLVVDALLRRPTPRQTIRAIDSVSMELRPGTRLGIYGPNGSGKSSLLRLMAGIYPPSSGTVTRTGRCTSLLGLGLGANIELSARDNIALLLRLEGLEPTPELVRRIWEFTELDERFFRLSMRHFSTGMMMRLFFAVSTSTEPEILLMDEWLSVVDERFMHKAEDRLRTYVGRAQVFVIASHNFNLLRDVCDTIVHLEAGRAERFEKVQAEPEPGDASEPDTESI